jgi:tetratricopeptide (TPR) repeat protein
VIKSNSIRSKFSGIGIRRAFLVLGITPFLTYGAFALAVSGITRLKNPDVALRFVPDESAALAAKADQLFFAKPQNPPETVRRLALDALHSQAFNPKALRLLGYFYDARGDSARAERYVRKAAHLSRREPGAQLWLIEASARSGDVEKTLKHYDIALRTKPETQTILYPRLLKAIEDKEIRTALKPYFRDDSSWMYGFLVFASGNSNNLPALVDLIVETGGLTDVANARERGTALLTRLVAENYYEDARRLFLKLPGNKPARVTSASFDASDRDSRFGPMGWQLVEDPNAGGGFTGGAGDRRTMLSLFANSATTRPVATKLLYLAPGNYLFSARLANLDRGDGGFLRWQLRCPAIGGTPVWTIDSINALLRAELSVPANCPVQFLDIVASGGKGQMGLEATVASVSVAPAS